MGTPEYACVVALSNYAASLGVPLSSPTMNRTALAASLSVPLTASNAAALIQQVAANPYGRDIAWSVFKSRATDIVGWYTGLQTLSGLASSLGANLHSMGYANDEAATWSGLWSTCFCHRGILAAERGANNRWIWLGRC